MCSTAQAVLRLLLVRFCALAMSCALSNVLRKLHAAVATRDAMDAITDPTAEQKALRARHGKYMDDVLYQELLRTTHAAQGPDAPDDPAAMSAAKAKAMKATAMKAMKTKKARTVMKKPAKLLKEEKAVKQMLLDMRAPKH